MEVISLSKCVGLIQSLFKIFFSSPGDTEKNFRKIIVMVQFPSDTPQQKLINSYVFKKVTGAIAPINDINIILNSFDPFRALHIYKVAPGFIYIKDGKIEQPQRIKYGSIPYYILITLFWVMAGSACYGLLLIPSLDITNINIIKSCFIISFVAFCVSAIVFAIKQRIFLNFVDRFYYDLEQYNGANKK